MSGSVYPGIAAPASTTFDLTTTDPAFDLSTTTAAVLEIIFGDETTATWTCTTSTISGVPAANGIRLTRLHDAADVPAGSEGTLHVRAVCTLSGGGVAASKWRSISVERAGT